MLFYYTLFDSKMGRHRDNYNLKWFKSILNDEAATAGTPMGGHENSQHVGSDVLIYTQGDTPMDFQLSFPQPGNLDCATKEYVMKPAFAVSLSAGTLLIYRTGGGDHDSRFSRSACVVTSQQHPTCAILI